jgi:hypothetical protein
MTAASREAGPERPFSAWRPKSGASGIAANRAPQAGTPRRTRDDAATKHRADVLATDRLVPGTNVD